MKNQFTAVIERERGWFVAHCLEIPGASGQGPTEEAAQKSLAEAISLILLGQATDAAGEDQLGEPEGTLH